uniref:ATP synthase subunit delta, chloroplastic n=1 Tax=Taenioma perpusillum TaxID=210852 RepID=A0A1Z1MQW5_9FLOR|nr:ATP synthase CF1 subunit delta [Taenioma perpusillum]ARW68493.1 ATP synthase CF1 subunit delta [Taenioma perpusillum]
MKNQNLIEKISVPYAEALLNLAEGNNLLLEVKNNLSLILDFLSSSEDLQLLLSNPLINVNTKKTILKKIFEKNLNQTILNFLFVLVDKRRISILSTIINKYFELSYKIESVTLAEVTTAYEFSETQHNELVEKIKNLTQTNNIKLIIKIDSNLIGGFILKIGSKIIDTSLSGKLRQMSLHLNS